MANEEAKRLVCCLVKTLTLQFFCAAKAKLRRGNARDARDGQSPKETPRKDAEGKVPRSQWGNEKVEKEERSEHTRNEHWFYL